MFLFFVTEEEKKKKMRHQKIALSGSDGDGGRHHFVSFSLQSWLTLDGKLDLTIHFDQYFYLAAT